MLLFLIIIGLGIIKMFVPQVTPLYGGTGPDGSVRLIGWL